MCTIFPDSDQIFSKYKRLKRKDVRTFLEWSIKQPHFPKLTEHQAILFLHGANCNIEEAKIKIDIYLTRRTLHPHIFNHMDEHDLRNTCLVTIIGSLPKKTPENFNIFLAKWGDNNPSRFNFTNSVKLLNMFGCLYVYEFGPLDGAVIVFDCKGTSLAHLAKANLLVARHSLYHLQEGAPIGLQGIHLINAVPFMDKILAMVKPFLATAVYNLIHVHSSFETFYKYVPKECLPTDYGGESPSCKVLQEQTLNYLLNNYPFFKWHDSQQIDESKRDRNSNIYGLDGTFRMLEID